jgi:glycerate dehydrogenase
MFFSLLFEITNQVGLHSQSVRNGDWENNLDFCYWKTPLIELEGKTMGIIGYGNIGKCVADVALAFGMKVLVSSRTVKDDSRVEWVSREKLLAESDVIGLCCPLNSDTERMINADTLALMKPSAILINTSRGAVIDDEALANALNSGKLYAAGLDVLTVEPPKNNPLTSAKNCFITPHIAWASFDARTRLMNTAVANLEGFLNGKLQNVVN